jgi:PleD family two-component response regulator
MSRRGPSLGPIPGPSKSLKGTILVIDEERAMREALARFLRAKGRDVVTTATGYKALAVVNERALRPALVISNYNIAGHGWH